MLLVRAYVIAIIFPLVARSSNPPGTKSPSIFNNFLLIFFSVRFLAFIHTKSILYL
ncbi:CTP synthetase [Rickettsia akari str. Hartford]|uniref:CTP synthetase n=1 Tax=Rickettsia akari (strain Hartford) TaxID=293614 RepID=A8GN85_RICAH|nr:CTP synthetase [Rickettsia akari str. Hartford]